MALFFILFCIIIYSFSFTLGFDNDNILLEIKPTPINAGQNMRFYKVDDTLNLTCIFKNETILPDVVLEWIVPSKASNRENHLFQTPGTNYVNLIIKNLRENDSGEYKCKAVYNGIPFFNSERSVQINVKNKKKECTDVMFQCSPGICIPKRYTCDGLRDCSHGEDEAPSYCGPGNPCDNKLMCPENRCIPFTWCCESHREPNCTTKIKHSCCVHVEKLTRDVDGDLEYQYEQQRFSDMGFLQTTVYTVIGCAMAFMFIVTIVVIAICRVHVRRTLLPRCQSVNRNSLLSRNGSLHGNHMNGVSFYDLDVYFNRSGLTDTDLMTINPLLVTYNINNGVQFMGRPIDPPPYCEIVTSPPKEGPPPPYASQENLRDCEHYGKVGKSKTERKVRSETYDEAEALLTVGSIQSGEQIDENSRMSAIDEERDNLEFHSSSSQLNPAIVKTIQATNFDSVVLSSDSVVRTTNSGECCSQMCNSTNDTSKESANSAISKKIINLKNVSSV